MSLFTMKTFSIPTTYHIHKKQNNPIFQIIYKLPDDFILKIVYDARINKLK